MSRAEGYGLAAKRDAGGDSQLPFATVGSLYYQASARMEALAEKKMYALPDLPTGWKSEERRRAKRVGRSSKGTGTAGQSGDNYHALGSTKRVDS